MTHKTLLLSVLLAITSLCINATAKTKWTTTKGTLCLVDANKTIGHIDVKASNTLSYSQKITTIDPTTYKLTYTFTALHDTPDAHISLSFIHEGKPTYWMIPSISYDGNNWGRGGEPKGACDEYGLTRTYSYRRTPIPGCTYSEGTNYSVATWSNTPADSTEDFSCSLLPTASSATHSIMWPEQELPTLYYDRDNFKQGYQRHASMLKGQHKTFVLYVSATPTLPNHKSISTFLNTCWQMAKSPKFNIHSPSRLWDLGVQYAKESLWAEEGIYKGFSIGLLWNGSKWYQRTAWKYESGWCGQNISLANSMLSDYKKTGNQESLNKGITALDTWANNCPLPNGLFITHFDTKLNNETNAILDACNLGTSALNFFEAYHLAKECNIERPNYLTLTLNICNFIKADQQANGCYARGWYMDGTAYVREGTVGCFIVPAMIQAYNETHNQDYLTSATKAYQYYIDELLTKGYSTAGALDTWCIDKESSITLLRSSLSLYKITHNQQYLDNAIQTSYYLSTWLWHYDEQYPSNDAFTINQWHTFGATSVSVQHHHLDPYALYWVPEWVELSQLTGDPQWRQKAMAIWCNGNQLVSDGTLVVNGKLRPVGSQNEAYFESNWCFSTPDRRINDWLVSWPCAFRLETLRKLHNSDFFK